MQALRSGGLFWLLGIAHHSLSKQGMQLMASLPGMAGRDAVGTVGKVQPSFRQSKQPTLVCSRGGAVG